MTKFFCSSVMIFLSYTLFAQEGVMESAQFSSTPTVVTYLGTFQPEATDPDLLPMLKGLGGSINKGADHEALIRYKDSLNTIKLLKGLKDVPANKTTAFIDPIKVSGFGTIGTQGTPSDNTLAINKDGKMIAAVNSWFRVYNKNGAADGGTKDFTNFWSSVTNKNNLCDPLVFFDPQANRFIIFTQICDRSTQDNKVLVAFSTSNNPAGSYHYFSFKTNLKELNSSYPVDVWFDYPKMGVSGSDVFITGNLFRNSGQQSFFVESIVLQIDKNAAFAGTTPTSLIHSAIPGNPFTLVPAGHGRESNYGDLMYLCATNGKSSNNNIKLYSITGKVQNSPTMAMTTVSIPNFGVPADGLQAGTNILLNSGDSRGMSAMYVDGTIHYVFHGDGPGHDIAINYSRLSQNGNVWSAQNKIISSSNFDYAYPSVASIGYNDQDQSAIIVFDYSGGNFFPGIRTVFVDHNMTVSDPVELFTGLSFINQSDPNRPGTTRWGDYTGIAREHNAAKPTVWGYGMYGDATNVWANYVSQITTSAWPVEVANHNTPNQQVSVYPNPVIDIWNIKLDFPEAGAFSVEIYDMMGKKVRNVFSRNVSKGPAIFSFNKNGLPSGTYFVKIGLNNNVLANEKIIVSQ